MLFERCSPSGFVLLYDGGNSGGFSSFKMIGDLLPISGFSSNSSWNMTGIPFERNDRRSSSSPTHVKKIPIKKGNYKYTTSREISQNKTKMDVKRKRKM